MPSASAIASAAGCISEQWNGAETGRITPRLMPYSFASVTARSIELQSTLSTALAGGATITTAFGNDPLARQLKTVANLIAARASLGMTRQVYFVSMGGFDVHDGLTTRHPLLMQQLGGALGSFDAALRELGMADQVTTFTASDFVRTLSSNGDGTDHG